MRGLQAAEQVLKPGGRLAVVTFHSLEDRMVKQFLARAPAAQVVRRAICPMSIWRAQALPMPPNAMLRREGK